MKELKMADAILTQDYLKSILNYDQHTGVFTKIVNNVITEVGSHNGNGYIRIIVNKKTYKAHRLAWLYMTGKMPTKVIDHINGIRNDNRFCNLREVSIQQNAQNIRKARADNKSGYLGVNVDKGKFAASIKVNGRKKYLGSFETPEMAHQAYIQAKRIMHECGTL